MGKKGKNTLIGMKAETVLVGEHFFSQVKVTVRLAILSQNYRGLGEFGRPRWAHIPETMGSNPIPATTTERRANVKTK